MTEEDWKDLSEKGDHWLPQGKGRLLVLEKDDVLLMPPGVRQLHSVYTPIASLMEGGMCWDHCNILPILENLYSVCRHQSSTNEPVPLQLPAILKIPPQYVSENIDSFSKTGQPELIKEVEAFVAKFEGLGCTCVTCEKACSCLAEGRRCTAWCARHSMRGRHYCMSEGGDTANEMEKEMDDVMKKNDDEIEADDKMEMDEKKTDIGVKWDHATDEESSSEYRD